MKCEDIEPTLDSAIPTLNLLKFAPIKEEIKSVGNPDVKYPERRKSGSANEPDCYATQLLLENTNESLVHTILKTEKTSDVPSTAVCEEHIIKDELNTLKPIPLFIGDKNINVVFVENVLPRSNLKFIFLTVDINLTIVTFVARVLLQRIISRFIFVVMMDKEDIDLTNVIFVAGVSIGRNILKVTSLLIVDESDCNTARLLLESSSKTIVRTVIKPEKTFNVTARVVCEENSSKYEKCFDECSIDISKDNIIERCQNFVNGTEKNVGSQGKGILLKGTTFENIDPNLFHMVVKKYKCKGYNKPFSKTINSGPRPHQCDICGKCFKRTRVLNYHILTHGGQRLICDVCGKCFKRKDYLKSHILTHSGQKPHKCDVCGKSFNRKDYLKFHFFNHNDQKRTHKCEVCGKCFASSRYLKGHRLTHSGLRPHKCDICDKCFTKKSHLKIHLRIHSKSRPLNCGVCGKSFYRNDHLKSHLLTHSEHSPFKCDVCGKCFNLKRILKIHILTHIKQIP
uniref:C2H2-type domain-containing protein n=1 Tax=Timema genevievae TaxID=629358 RepID=A0A7R9JXZ2_TIMGE|nr:unnamed protein product [Timema genevievae]